MKSSLCLVNRYRTKSRKIVFVLLLAFFLMPCVGESKTPEADKVLAYLKGLGNGRYMFGQMATWVNNENPDMDHPTNWPKKTAIF